MLPATITAPRITTAPAAIPLAPTPKARALRPYPRCLFLPAELYPISWSRQLLLHRPCRPAVRYAVNRLADHPASPEP